MTQPGENFDELIKIGFAMAESGEDTQVFVLEQHTFDLKDLAHAISSRGVKWSQELYDVFSELYDDLSHQIWKHHKDYINAQDRGEVHGRYSHFELEGGYLEVVYDQSGHDEDQTYFQKYSVDPAIIWDPEIIQRIEEQRRTEEAAKRAAEEARKAEIEKELAEMRLDGDWRTYRDLKLKFEGADPGEQPPDHLKPPV
jgi:hypothetical protein